MSILLRGGEFTMAKLRKNGNGQEPFKLGARGYTDAPKDIEEAMKSGPLVGDLIPEGATFTLKRPGPAETRKMKRAWKRYQIKDHERGHRTPLSEKFKTQTRRFNTCTTLPENVYSWIKTKRNRADYLRDLLLKEYRKTHGAKIVN
jgi:hypothetical protein